MKNPWDAARSIPVVRGSETYPAADLEPGVKYFVLQLEKLGAVTKFSCEGHPRGFYIVFAASYALAKRISGAGFFNVSISGTEWRMDCAGIDDVHATEKKKRQTMRWAAVAWEKHFGPLKGNDNG